MQANFNWYWSRCVAARNVYIILVEVAVKRMQYICMYWAALDGERKGLPCVKIPVYSRSVTYQLKYRVWEDGKYDVVSRGYSKAVFDLNEHVE